MRTEWILPGGKLGRFEAVGELLVGHQGLLGLVGASTDQRKAEVVGPEADRIEEDPLFSKRAGALPAAERLGRDAQAGDRTHQCRY